MPPCHIMTAPKLFHSKRAKKLKKKKKLKPLVVPVQKEWYQTAFQGAEAGLENWEGFSLALIWPSEDAWSGNLKTFFE